MSDPRHDYNPPLEGIILEAISAMSSLNMVPDPIPNAIGECLSETDSWAKHSMEHLSAVCRLAERARRRSEKMFHLLRGVLELQYDIDVPIMHDDIEQWMLYKLDEIYKNLRQIRRDQEQQTQ